MKDQGFFAGLKELVNQNLNLAIRLSMRLSDLELDPSLVDALIREHTYVIRKEYRINDVQPRDSPFLA